jgi:hypothetical protein
LNGYNPNARVVPERGPHCIEWEIPAWDRSFSIVIEFLDLADDIDREFYLDGAGDA